MFNTIINLIKKYKSVILYLIFGVSSTILNILTYYFLTNVFEFSYVISNIISWIVAVTFAYFTNRVYVFNSKAKEKKHIIKEFFLFYYYRIMTLILEMIIMFVFIDLLNINDMVIKIIANIIVIIANYILSKFVVFNSKRNINKYNNK